MTSSLSAAKRVRQNAKSRARNRTRTSAMKTAMRKVETAAAEGDAAALKAAVSEAYKRIDKAAQVNIIHAKTAARRKALVTRRAAAKA
jgi:small subunit ribosomal protein S20